MRLYSVTFVFALSTLLFVSTLSAQQTTTAASAMTVPNLIRYSGTLKDAQGAASVSPATVGVTFAIYKQQDGGASVWQETQNVTPDASGQYSVILGSTTATGLPDDLFSQQEQRWLGVQVQGQAEQARVLLVSVPYAFKAHEAETLGGLPASAFVQNAPSNASGGGSTDTGTAVNALSNTGNTGSTSATAARKKAAVKHRPCASPPWPVGPFSVDVPPAKDGNIFEDCNGDIGINNTSPSTQLDVNGDVNAWLWYDITSGELPFLSIGWPAPMNLPGNQNTWLGLGAGGQGSSNTKDSGTGNTFVGYKAGVSNAPSSTAPAGNADTFLGAFAGNSNTTGYFNSFFGASAGNSIATGNSDVCIGYNSCYTNDTTNNTIVGRSSGFSNSGNNVTCLGVDTCYNNTADNNTFVGFNSGTANTSGGFNTFVGSDTGVGNVNGGANTYLGRFAGFSNVSGNNNVLVGDSAGFFNTGGFNTFVGSSAGNQHATGNGNTFVGNSAGLFAVTGASNTYLGNGAGSNNPNNGSNNTFVGFNAGVNNATGNNNVYLANAGPVPNENNTIRIGVLGPYGAHASTQTDTYVQGIWGAASEHPGKIVCVGIDGKLWGASGIPEDPCYRQVSSRRFKDQIVDMSESSSRLFQLRPVTFFYKPQYDDGSHSLQYGLIAEEVAKVYPEMAVYDKDGRPSGVKYQMLAPMLLSELQKEHIVVMAQQDELQTQLHQINAQRQEIDGLKHELQLQNASLQERLQKLESYVETQMKTASDVRPATIASANGGVQ